ncbi:hypothetical protein [Pseudomonas fluorescens]
MPIKLTINPNSSIDAVPQTHLDHHSKVSNVKIRAILMAATVIACLTGCVTPAQLQRQNDQLLLINTNLLQIQANQLKAQELQKNQISLQMQGNAQQALSSALTQGKGHDHD